MIPDLRVPGTYLQRSDCRLTFKRILTTKIMFTRSRNYPNHAGILAMFSIIVELLVEMRT